MFSYPRCLYLIVLIACFARTAFAVRCFLCESDYDPNCSDLKFITDPLMHECGRNGTGSCLKVVISGERSNIIRTCSGYLPGEDEGCRLEQVKCYKCDHDLCNNSTSVTPITAVVALIFTLVRIMS